MSHSIPSTAYVPPPSITFPHQPDAHGTADNPGSFSISVALKENESLQLPSSPLDRH